MKAEIRDEAEKILRAIAAALKIQLSSLCICGRGKLYGGCCATAGGSQLAKFEAEFDKAGAYRDSQGGTIRRLPAGIFNVFVRKASSGLKCLYPGCSRKPVSCHLIPKNVLKKAFAGSCLSYGLHGSDGVNQFSNTGVSNAGTLPVFCSDHDNGLFKETDNMEDSTTAKQRFLLAFKAIAFSLRRTQILLFLDYQVEIFRPVLIANSRTQTGRHITIDISKLREQYLRFGIAWKAFSNAAEAYSREDWEHFTYLQRDFSSGNTLFYAEFANPPHDLEGSRLNTSCEPIHMTLSILAGGSCLRAFFAAPNGPSAKAYGKLFRQLGDADEEVFLRVLNSFITAKPHGALLSSDFTMSQIEQGRISGMASHLSRCMKPTEGCVLDLTDTTRSVAFVSSKC